MRTKPMPSQDADDVWVQEQLDTVYGPEDGYSDAQFEADVEKASPALEALAEKARKALEEGTALKFPR